MGKRFLGLLVAEGRFEFRGAVADLEEAEGRPGRSLLRTPRATVATSRLSPPATQRGRRPRWRAGLRGGGGPGGAPPGPRAAGLDPAPLDPAAGRRRDREQHLLHLWALPHLHPVLTAFSEEERSVTHTGLPILVSLANKAVSFHCSITYPYTPEFKNFTVRYFHVDLQGRTSSEEKISCQPGTGSENQTHTTVCPITLKPPNASATGTYYCSVLWPDFKMMGKGTFILVRDTGYQEPPQGPQKLLLSCFVGILAVLSILATALLLWKKGQMKALWKHAAKKCPGPTATSSPGQPPSESVYTDLQHRESEVYDCIGNEAGSPPASQGLLSQEKQRKFEGDGEFNLVYENL
ncbi:NFAT activation molecule 1 [Odocoileus virginianus]|uniref:NFAT activation molecule 1 n=1 Tax=Odocoileus virginianus TaxID=9874 RepID=A0ABM4H3X1_ODOVR